VTRSIPLRATIHDVALAAGVSIKTVSRVMNNEPAVRPETEARVRAAAQALDYMVLPAARQLGGGRTHSLGMLIVARRHWQWTADLIAGAVTRSRERGYVLAPQVLSVGDQAERRTLLALAASRVVDGLIVTTPWAEDDELLAAMTERGMPFVLAPAPVGSQHPGVRADDEGAAFEVTRHLLELGHRRVAVLAGQPRLDVTVQRLKGFRRAMHEFQVRADPALEVFADYTFRTGYRETRKLLKGPRPTAIVAFTDVLASAAVRAAHEMGVTPPRDLSVVGVGDLAVSQMIWPPLTTAVIPSVEVAALAVDLLVDRIEARPTPAQAVTLSTQLLVRSSSGPPPS
jgi:LacI family transcriptional regulator